MQSRKLISSKSAMIPESLPCSSIGLFKLWTHKQTAEMVWLGIKITDYSPHVSIAGHRLDIYIIGLVVQLHTSKKPDSLC